MIEQSLDAILKTRPKNSPKRTSTRKLAIGGAAVAALSAFVLKTEIAKVYFDLSNDIREVQQQVDAYQPLEADQIYIVDKPCIREVEENLYEVTPCLTSETGR